MQAPPTIDDPHPPDSTRTSSYIDHTLTITNTPRRELPQASPTTIYSQPPVPTRLSSHIDGTSASPNRQSVRNSSLEPTITTTPRRDLTCAEMVVQSTLDAEDDIKTATPYHTIGSATTIRSYLHLAGRRRFTLISTSKWTDAPDPKLQLAPIRKRVPALI